MSDDLVGALYDLEKAESEIDRLNAELAAADRAHAVKDARIAGLERHLENSGMYGNAGRYWEGRWRDEHTGNAGLLARIAELEAELATVNRRFDELHSELMERGARAERAEARIAELEKSNTGLVHDFNTLLVRESQTEARTECAEAERDAMRGMLVKAENALDQAECVIDADDCVEVFQCVQAVRKQVRAALNPPPAGREG